MKQSAPVSPYKVIKILKWKFLTLDQFRYTSASFTHNFHLATFLHYFKEAPSVTTRGQSN